MIETNKRDGGEVELLPLPEPLQMSWESPEGYDDEMMEAYARANVERALAESREKEAESFQKYVDANEARIAAEARAERLAVLLHEAWGHVPSGTLADQIHVALTQESSIMDYIALRERLDDAEAEAARYRWLAENIGKLPYPDAWGDKAWLDARIDALHGQEESE